VAFRLDLPEHSSVHPVFHDSQLKQAVGATHQVTPTLPSDFAIHLAPEQVLQTRTVVRGTSSMSQVLVKWNNLPSALTTCEDYKALRQEFPRATAWGQAVFQEGGNVINQPTQAHEGTPEDQPRRTRARKPNPRVYGEQWA
jgi:hypothetical protein